MSAIGNVIGERITASVTPTTICVNYPNAVLCVSEILWCGIMIWCDGVGSDDVIRSNRLGV